MALYVKLEYKSDYVSQLRYISLVHIAELLLLAVYSKSEYIAHTPQVVLYHQLLTINFDCKVYEKEQ